LGKIQVIPKMKSKIIINPNSFLINPSSPNWGKKIKRINKVFQGSEK